MSGIKKLLNIGKDGKKLEPLYIAGVKVNGTTASKALCQFLKWLNIELTIWPSNLIPKYMPQRNETYVQTKTCIYIFIAAFFAIAER